MELSVTTTIFLLTFGGYILYGKNIFKEETQDFFIFPWVTFSFLAGLDWVNILLSEDMIWFEAFAGGLMFAGPVMVSLLILYNGFRIHGKDRKISFLVKKIKKEYIQSKAEAMLLLVGGIILLLLYVIDNSSLGGNYWLELAFAGATIFLDAVALIALVSEIRETPEKFERISWSLWVIAALLGVWWNIHSGADQAAIGTILIFEAALVSGCVLTSIQYFKDR